MIHPAPAMGVKAGGVIIREEGEPVRTRRYLIFAGDHYYPIGGWGDLIGSTDDRDEAIAAAQASDQEWHHVIDLETGKDVS